MYSISRRAFLTSVAGGAASCTLIGTQGCAQLDSAQLDSAQVDSVPTVDQHARDWAVANDIRRQTVVPEFPPAVFDIRDFGAVSDTETNNSAAFAAAIDACSAAGGGRVLVTEGNYLTGPIHLKSNINLHVDEGARIRFVTDPQSYLPAVFTRWEGMEFMGYSPLIYAYKQKNIAITGKGVLDGQANRTTWWPWKGNEEWGVEGMPTQDAGRAQLERDVAAGVPPERRRYSEGYYFRPPFVQPYLCENVLIEGVKIVSAPFWLLNPVLCQNVTVRDVTLASLGPNSDGCDPESCKNVVIEGCFFDTGDDCIAIKSGRNADGRRINQPAENMVIANCQMRAGHGGVVIGSEISGGARNIFVENCEMSSPDLERGIRIKTNSVRGGLIEHLRYRNITIGEVQDAIVINFYYEEGDAGRFDPTVRDIEIRDLVCQKAESAFQIRGFARAPITDLRIINAHFRDAEDPGVIEHVDKLIAKNVTVNGKKFAL
jgi:polygalacturonase